LTTGPTYPGVYIEEVPGGVPLIAAVATSITAFIGRAQRGPCNRPTRVQNFLEFERTFGSLWVDSTMSYAVRQYFVNGGSDAVIVRVHNGAAKATIDLPGASGTLSLEALGEGVWGNNLRVLIDYDTQDPTDAALFNLTIEEEDPTTGEVASSESFSDVSTEAGTDRYVARLLQQQSALAVTSGTVPPERPTASSIDQATGEPIPISSNNDGSDGSEIDASHITDPSLKAAKCGLWALDDVDVFNLLCIPPFTRDLDADPTMLDTAATYCEERRAMLIVDPPSGWTSKDAAVAGITAFSFAVRKNAAVFFPRILVPDPLQQNQLVAFAPCGAVAGIFARTDRNRGVWKAPAGQDATLLGVSGLDIQLNDSENGELTPLGVNCLRTFPTLGSVVWGARTLDGADDLASEWKYIPVRRMALFIEESLYQGLKWVVFEPNDEPLWSRIRLSVGTFMDKLFRQGAFEGSTPDEAYLVKCGSETTTQADVGLGIINILVGFAPLKPVEFVILKIQQMAGLSEM
jgi:phage tail sheath protein FI